MPQAHKNAESTKTAFSAYNKTDRRSPPVKFVLLKFDRKRAVTLALVRTFSLAFRRTWLKSVSTMWIETTNERIHCNFTVYVCVVISNSIQSYYTRALIKRTILDVSHFSMLNLRLTQCYHSTSSSTPTSHHTIPHTICQKTMNSINCTCSSSSSSHTWHNSKCNHKGHHRHPQTPWTRKILTWAFCQTKLSSSQPYYKPERGPNKKKEDEKQKFKFKSSAKVDIDSFTQSLFNGIETKPMKPKPGHSDEKIANPTVHNEGFYSTLTTELLLLLILILVDSYLDTSQQARRQGSQLEPKPRQLVYARRCKVRRLCQNCPHRFCKRMASRTSRHEWTVGDDCD